MNFVVREAKEEDLSSLYDLAKQFSLLNLPADKRFIAEKIENSMESFAGEAKKEKAKFLFVAEDLESGRIAGSSQVKAKHGTLQNPTYSFKLLKKERFSRDLGIGFIHQILRLQICTNGPTEIGGLVVDKFYRRRPERIGRLTSLVRFLFIGMRPNYFEKELHSEMAPPLTDEGRSEFWEALGRRFTGMPYQEADALSTQNKEFIRSLFPEEDIYLCLLDSKARLVIGRVGSETMPALHMLEKIGFKYKEEVDPFDGGPHLGVKTSDVTIVKGAKYLKAVEKAKCGFTEAGLVAVIGEDGFRSGFSAFTTKGSEIKMPKASMAALKISHGDQVYCYKDKKRG